MVICLSIAVITSRQTCIEAVRCMVVTCRLHLMFAREKLLRPHALAPVAIHLLEVHMLLMDTVTVLHAWMSLVGLTVLS
jgi:hypothetical protein